MACRYTFKGKTYSASEFMRVLSDLPPSEAAAFMPGVNSVPSAPFIDSTPAWSLLAFKRMVRWAAENGFDSVAWTTGEQQAARYDLSKHVSEVYAERDKIRDGYYMTVTGKNGDTIFDSAGYSFDASKLEAHVGKELAEKIVSDLTQPGDSRTYAGLDLKVGGEGMRGFYDKILPAEVNKWAKAFGGKVGETYIPTDSDTPFSEQVEYRRTSGGMWWAILPGEQVVGGQPRYWTGKKWAASEGDARLYDTKEDLKASVGKTAQHSLPLTPAMRDAALAGLPLFSKADATKGAINDSPIREGDVFKYTDTRAATVIRVLPGGKVELAIKGTRNGKPSLSFGMTTTAEVRKLARYGRAPWDGGKHTPVGPEVFSDEPTQPGLFSRPDAAPGDVVLSEKAKESVKTFLDRVGAKLSDMKPALLGAIPLNYLADYAHKDMPAVKQFVELRQQLEAFRNKKHTEFDAIAQDWLSYITVGGWKGWLGQQTERGKELSDLMHDTTIVGVDPTLDRSEYTDDADKLARYDELRRRYDAMPEEGQRLYRTTRDAYAKQARDVERALEDNLKKAADFRRDQADIAYTARLEDIADSNASAETKQAQREIAAKEHDRALKAATSSMSAKIIGLRKLFESMRVEAPYFPLKRFGSLFAAVRDADGNLLSFSKFENLADANAFAAEHKKQGHSVFIGADIEKETALSHIDPRFVAEVDEILAGLQPEGPTPGERFADGERMTAEDADKGDAMRDIRDAIYQRYLESLPDLSLRKSFIHRKKTPGYNPDALRSFASTMFHGSYQLARLKYGIDLQSALLAAQEQAKRVDPVDGVRLANELAKRLAWIQNPAGGKAAQAITGAAFVWYLGANPAHLFLNATQTVMLGVPILGSKYGFTKTSRAFKEAAADFLRGKGHIEKARLSADERKAMQTFIDSGLIDKTQAHDLAGVGDTGAEYSALRSRVMGKIGWFFHQSERFNREVTALAAYRLARADGKIHDAAVKQAADHTWAIHFDYSAANRARYMQGDTAKVLTIFRNYNVNILYRLFRDIHTAFRGESKDAKIEAGKQLGAMMGMYGLMAGMAGMPFYGLLMMLASALDDDDEPFDAETRMKQGIVDLLGQDAAKVLLGGVPGALVGVDLSERIGMPNLWFRSPDRELEGRDAYFYWMEQIAGAGAGIPKSIFSGLQQINEGNVERGVESMLPNLAKSPVKAFRYAMQGQETNLDGDKLADIGTGGAIVRALGFTPASVAEQYDNNRALKSADAKLIKRRQQLMNRYAMALEMGDRDEVPGIIEAITRFNAINPAMAITRDTLRRSLKVRARNDALNQGGIVMTPRLRALAERQGE